MRTVKEVSVLAGVSIRTLQHYDKIGLLRPSKRSEAGWRLYADEDLVRLQQILLFRELEFPLKDIKRILESSDFDQEKALEDQIRLLELKQEHLSNLVALAKALKKGVGTMSFSAFDTSKIDEYREQAKKTWEGTPAWSEYEKRSEGRSREDEIARGAGLMALFEPFHAMLVEGTKPDSPRAMRQASIIQEYITDNFYTCTDEIFEGLGKAYGAGGDFTENIDGSAGPGTALFAAGAIEAYLLNK
jgi:DNA-binding transcriptional MerR regulator